MRYLVLGIYVAAPLVALGAENSRLLTPADLAPYYVAALVLTLLVTVVVAWRRGSAAADSTAACLAVALLVAFDYYDVRPGLAALTHEYRPSMVFLWAVAIGLTVFVIARLARRTQRLLLLMLVAGVALLVPSGIRWTDQGIAQSSAVGGAGLRGATRNERRAAPNVYFFLLDAYARTDRLREQFHFDNSPFVRALRSSGFVVPPRSVTAYGITTLSVPTILEARYALTHGHVDGDSIPPIFAGHNAVMATFRSLGYSIALAPAELEDMKCDGSEDICVRATKTYASHLGVSPVTWAVLETTPVADLMRSVAPVHLNPLTAARQFPLDVAKQVTRARGRRPVFTYAHVLLPHWPYLYLGPNCSLTSTRGRRGAADYLRALECTNANVEAAIHHVIARDPQAAIIVASDHGSDIDADGTKPQWEWSRTEVRYRLSNFLAMRLPAGCRSRVPAHIVTVNIFRVVLNCLAEPDLPLLPEKQFLTGPGLEVRPVSSLTG